jgi:hypothetical protein
MDKEGRNGKRKTKPKPEFSFVKNDKMVNNIKDL